MAELRRHYSNLNKKYKGLIVKFKKTTADQGDKIGAMYRRQMQMFP